MVVCRWFPCGSSQKWSSWHQGPQMQTSNGSGPQWGCARPSFLVCLSVCVYESERLRRVQEQVHRNRIETEMMKANNSSGEGKDGRVGGEEEEKARTMKGKEDGELFTPARDPLDFFREFQECCAWECHFCFDEFDYLVSVVGDATARQTAIMVPTILLETFEDKSDEAKVIDSFRYLSPYRVQARWYELCSLALKKNCHANAKFI